MADTRLTPEDIELLVEAGDITQDNMADLLPDMKDAFVALSAMQKHGKMEVLGPGTAELMGGGLMMKAAGPLISKATGAMKNITSGMGGLKGTAAQMGVDAIGQSLGLPWYITGPISAKVGGMFNKGSAPSAKPDAPWGQRPAPVAGNKAHGPSPEPKAKPTSRRAPQQAPAASGSPSTPGAGIGMGHAAQTRPNPAAASAAAQWQKQPNYGPGTAQAKMHQQKPNYGTGDEQNVRINPQTGQKFTGDSPNKTPVERRSPGGERFVRPNVSPAAVEGFNKRHDELLDKFGGTKGKAVGVRNPDKAHSGSGLKRQSPTEDFDEADKREVLFGGAGDGSKPKDRTPIKKARVVRRRAK